MAALLRRAALPLLAGGAAAATLHFSSMRQAAPTMAAECLKAAPTFSPGPLAHETDFDVVIVGAGIVGMATAREIVTRFPNKTVCVLEKEAEVAPHQTGHNSGVIHAGIYYKTGSTMARCCVEGARRMYEYCEEKKLPYSRCGKLIVAPEEKDHPTVEKLFATATANGVQGLEIVYADRIKEMEPNVRGYSALYSPNTGIVDFAVVARSFAEDVIETGRGTVKLRFEVRDFTPVEGGIVVRGCEPGQKGPIKEVRAKHVITCAGLQADRLAGKAGGSKHPKVVPFRGTYYQMKPEYRDIVKMNIYPVPSGGGIPVGVHFTPTVNERRGHGVIIGPGACIAFDREGYKFSDFSLRDLWDIASHVGMWKFVFSNFSLSVGEMYRDLNKRAFIREAQRLIPSVTDEMTEMSFAGVMVQVFDNDGNAANDFVFEHKCLGGTTLHVRSAPSPACTASMAIADHVVNVATSDFGWTK